MNIKKENNFYICYFKELDLRFTVDNINNAIAIGMALGIAKDKLIGGNL